MRNKRKRAVPLTLILLILTALSCSLPLSGEQASSTQAQPEAEQSQLGANEPDSAAQPSPTLPPPPTATPFPTPSPEPTPLGGGGTTLYYLSNREAPDDVLQIYRMDLASGQPVRITNSPLEKHNLVVSPDGSWAAFVSGEYEQWLIYTVDLQNGGDPLLVTPDMRNSGLPIWSPDSQWLAFTQRHLVCCSAVYVVRPDGSQMNLISSKSDYNYQPTWSPDSQWVGYTRQSNEGEFMGGALVGFPQSYAARVDGTERHAVVEMENYLHYAPGWAPDGSARIFFAEDQMRENSGLFRVDAGGSAPALLVDGDSLGYAAGQDTFYMVFSPDGSRAALAAVYPFATGDVMNAGQVHVLEAGGGSPRTIHDYYHEYQPHITPPSWTPDSASIAVEDSGHIYLVNVFSGDRTQLTQDGNNHAPTLVYDPVYVVPSQAPGQFEQQGAGAALDVQGSGRIAYVSEEAGAPDVHLLDLDAGTTARVSFDLGKEQHLAWSPDGTRLAYTSRDQWQSRLFVVDLVPGAEPGTPVEPVPMEGSFFSPSWSPDGSELVVVHQPDPEALPTQLLRVDLAGGGAVPIAGGGNINRFPTWSPGGGQIAYASISLEQAAVGQVAHLPAVHMLNLMDGSSVRVTGDEYSFEQRPLWAPGGGEFFYIKGSTVSSGVQVILSNVETWEEIIMIEAGELTTVSNMWEYNWMGAWSPDSALLAIISFSWDGEDDYFPGGYIYIFDLNTGELRFITDIYSTGYEGPTLQPPAWSPDGSQVLFTGVDRTTEMTVIYVLDMSTGQTRQISDPAVNFDAPAWAP